MALGHNKLIPSKNVRYERVITDMCTLGADTSGRSHACTPDSRTSIMRATLCADTYTHHKTCDSQHAQFTLSLVLYSLRCCAYSLFYL